MFSFVVFSVSFVFKEKKFGLGKQREVNKYFHMSSVNYLTFLLEKFFESEKRVWPYWL